MNEDDFPIFIGLFSVYNIIAVISEMIFLSNITNEN